MRTILFILLFIISINTCIGAEIHITDGTVDSYDLIEGNTYILDNDVSASGTAFEVKGNNIIFDGNNYNITFSNTNTGYGFVSVNYKNVTLQNCNFIQTSYVANSYGIYFYGLDYSKIFNCSVYRSRGYPLYLRQSYNNIIENITLHSQSATVIYCNDADNTVIKNTVLNNDVNGYGYIIENTKNLTIDNNDIYVTNMGISVTATSNNITIQNSLINAPFNVGIRLLDSHNNIVQNNTIISGNNIGLYLAKTATGCINNTINNNIIYGNETSITSSGVLYVYNGHNNTISQNNVYATGYYGAYFRETAYNNISNNYFSSNSWLGSLIGYGSNNNTVSKNTFEYKGINPNNYNRKGVFVYNGQNNIFSDNIVLGQYSKYPVNAVTHILIVGDSIAEGSGHTSIEYGGYQNHLNDLGTQYNAYFSNMGFTGERTNYGLERLSQTMDIFKPDIVLIGYGTNDILDGRDETDIIMEIITMCEIAEHKGAKPYVIANTPIYTENEKRISLNMNLSAYCAANEYEFINVYDAIDSVPLNNEYDLYVSDNYPDGIHPNNASNVLIAEYIYTYLEDDLQNNYNNYENSVFTAYWLGILFLVVLAIYVSKTNSMFDEFNLNEPSTIIKVLTAILMIVISISVLGDWF